jgi:uncharacterized protein (TIGR02687 family)
MSDLNQITVSLTRLFNEEGHRVVFWNDPDHEFEGALSALALDGVTVLKLTEVGQLEAKIRIERTEPDSKFLVYSPAEEPDYEGDWLLDMRLYSRSFRADRASILLQELKLANQSLRPHISNRRKFFDAKDRVQKLKGQVAPDDTAADLDRKMIAVVVRAEHSDLFVLVQTIFHAWCDSDEGVDLDAPPGVWEQVEKFDLDGSFWSAVKAQFGYAEENPTLKNFLLRLVLTDFAHHLKGEVPPALRPLLLPRTGWSNAVVCLAQWRDSSSRGTSYDRLSAAAAAVLKLDDHLPGFDIDHLLDVMTFLAVEKRVASGLRERVQSTAGTVNAEEVRAVASRRQAGHWGTSSLADSADAPRRALRSVYDALVCAADFFALRNAHKSGFDYPDAHAMYRAYETQLYAFDQHYRLFCEAADVAEREGWNVLKSLRAVVEQTYVNWYLTELAMAWGRFVEPHGGLLSKWQIEKVPNQYRFYERNVRPWLEEGENRKAFVIISDAFRYEAAQELATALNGRYRFEATLTSQLGVLPSYTALGMASLLPHKALGYKAGTKDVLVDGKPCEAGDRDGILSAAGGMACKADELMAKKKDEGREFVKDKRVVYIYHNKVDSTGDDGKTEGETFQAVRDAIGELAALVGYVVNNLNGHHIVVTADHGFLFAESAPTQTDKSPLDEKPAGTVLAKKRYLLGRGLPGHASAWHGSTATTAGAGDMEFWIPKGANRFHFVGGSRFVHGGAMPQEVVVPVLTVKHVRGKAAPETKTKSVAVQVLGGNHRITTGRHRFQLIQMEPVGERVKAITLRVAVYEGEEPVTNVEAVTFDSASGSMDERKKWVNLVLKDRQYDKKTPYRLILRDAETGVEQQSVEVTIDRAFTDDF